MILSLEETDVRILEAAEEPALPVAGCELQRGSRSVAKPAGGNARLLGALVVSGVLHTAPMALLWWPTSAALLGISLPGGSGWERMSPVTWEGTVVLTQAPVSREVVESPPPMPVVVQEEPLEHPDRIAEAPSLPEIVPSWDLPEGFPASAEAASPDGREPHHSRPASFSPIQSAPRREMRRRPAAPAGEQAQSQNTPGIVASPPGESGDHQGSGLVQGEGQTVGSVGTVPATVWNPQPIYPAVARRGGWEGVVEVELTIAMDGHVEEARVARSSGRELLDKAALSALRRWRFEPLGGNGRSLRLLQKVTFRLGDR